MPYHSQSQRMNKAIYCRHFNSKLVGAWPPSTYQATAHAQRACSAVARGPTAALNVASHVLMYACRGGLTCGGTDRADLRARSWRRAGWEDSGRDIHPIRCSSSTSV
jgi:hypothetical protein